MGKKAAPAKKTAKKAPAKKATAKKAPAKKKTAKKSPAKKAAPKKKTAEKKTLIACCTPDNRPSVSSTNHELCLNGTTPRGARREEAQKRVARLRRMLSLQDKAGS